MPVLAFKRPFRGLVAICPDGAPAATIDVAVARKKRAPRQRLACQSRHFFITFSPLRMVWVTPQKTFSPST